MKDQEELKGILEQQLQWTKDQIKTLDGMDEKLQAMKKIAEYAVENDLSSSEREELNIQLEKLKGEYDFLEKQRYNQLN